LLSLGVYFCVSWKYHRTNESVLNEIGADGEFRHCQEEKTAVLRPRDQSAEHCFEGRLEVDLTTQEAKDGQGDDGATTSRLDR